MSHNCHRLILATALMSGFGLASAGTFYFGAFQTGGGSYPNYLPPSHFAVLTTTANGAGGTDFELSYLSSSPFGAESKLTQLLLNVSSNDGTSFAEAVNLTPSIVGIQSVARGTDFTNAALGFDYGINLTRSKNDRLAPGETLRFSIANSSPAQFTETMMVHVQGLANGDSVKYVSAIPEPETYALMLAGLCLTGWMVRRRMAR